MLRPSPIIPLGLVLAASAPAVAAPSDAETWAVVVGSNRAGPGQVPLRYADDDAQRMVDVLTELGDVSPERVRHLMNPDVADVLDALTEVDAALEASTAAHRRVVFYYSGHARSTGLDLGDEALSLDVLRAELEGLSADLRLVVLDACQSGAISRGKGLSPAEAFSTASMQGLDMEGMAIIASSARDELSQESNDLEGSFFTHYLVVGLRGAADADIDGSVTLEEGYRYAYDRTVVSTSTTAIGRQHPTMETTIEGRGALVLTRPSSADARLYFPKQIKGSVVLIDRRGGVAGEVDMVRGDPLTVALPAGKYAVMWTHQGATEECSQRVEPGSTTTFEPEDCRVEAVRASVSSKGAVESETFERVFVEVGLGPFIGVSSSDFTDTLENFGYERRETPANRLLLQGAVTVHDHVGIVLQASTLDRHSWRRTGDKTASQSQSYSVRTQRAGAGLRGQLPLLRDWLVPYAQVTAGPLQLTESLEHSESQIRAYGAAAGGLHVMPRFGHMRVFGLFAQVELQRTSGLENLLGDRHELGGTQVSIGFRGGA